MSPKCRKGCIDDSGQPPPLKGHKCPFRKASQAQPIHILDDSARPSKRQKTRSYVSSPPGDPTHVISSVDTVNVSVPGPLLTLPIFDAIDTAASSSATPSDDGVEPANSESNDGDINFTDFLRFLEGYSAETQEPDKVSGPPGWYPLEDLLNAGAGSMQGMMDGHLSDDGGELDMLEGTGVTLEMNSGDMNTCVTAESSSEDTNVHGTDVTLEPSASAVDSDVLIPASCRADEPDQIVDGQYRSSDFTLVHDVAGDVAPPLQYRNNTAEGMRVQTEGKRLNKKRRRSVLYIANDRNRTKAHSERASRLVRVVKDLDKVSRPFIFLYIARPESILSKNGKSVIHISPALQAAFDAKGDHRPIMDIHETAMAYVRKQVLSSKDIIAINAEVHQAQAEKHQVMNELQNLQEAHSHELLAEQQRCQAVEAQLASLTQQLELSAYNI
ncbi:uncharacterized protein F5147DRAFT_821766 [Suillus discolor]|uniref:Uncharacterized protein n=1 Tax=Suillus discolor TaxID=1912936 RepID=A0A9P7EV21_9AGAM|nr:uncharacterized protein F5147DRAFT_821766 [Suillus discolor]KAG2092675.1 hypothetical protein F5147DRAFT_821766 [Suillus discolor]